MTTPDDTLDLEGWAKSCDNAADIDWARHRFAEAEAMRRLAATLRAADKEIARLRREIALLEDDLVDAEQAGYERRS